ncbi:MAG: hypothetical protein ACOC29_00685 [Candidatus Sumerlaeota bacterium]
MQTKALIEKVKPDVLAWMETVRYGDEGWGRWKYHAAMERPWALQASGIAISILESFGELERVPVRLREEAIAFFRSCQDPEDLLFKDLLETEDCHEGPHSWENIWGQRNGSAMQALALLGGEPTYGWPEKQFTDLRNTDGVAWMRSLDWENPWRHGETWWRAMHAFLQNLPRRSETTNTRSWRRCSKPWSRRYSTRKQAIPRAAAATIRLWPWPGFSN